MIVKDISEFKRGWFIGDFDPSMWKTHYFEAGLKIYNAGDEEPAHYHKLGFEFTVIVSGQASMNDVVIAENSVVLVQPGEVVKFKAITDVKTFVIKLPSLSDDKYLIQ